MAKATQMPSKLFRYVTDQHRQSRPMVTISRSARGLSVVMVVSGLVTFLVFATELAELGNGFAPYRPFVTFMSFSAMVLFIPLGFLLYCCTLKRAGPLLVIAFAAASILLIGVWYEFVGADSVRLTADTVRELRFRAYGLTCFSVGFPAGI